MYYNGQIVYDRDSKKPVKVGSGKSNWAWNKIPVRSSHFIKCDSKFGYEVFLPKTVEEAERLLEKGRISVAPIPDTHCHKCHNWWNNHNKDGSCLDSI